MMRLNRNAGPNPPLTPANILALAVSPLRPDVPQFRKPFSGGDKGFFFFGEMEADRVINRLPEKA
jgi:hypothetical protein